MKTRRRRLFVCGYKAHAGQPSDNVVRQRRWTGTEFLIFMSRNGDQ